MWCSEGAEIAGGDAGNPQGYPSGCSGTAGEKLCCERLGEEDERICV